MENSVYPQNPSRYPIDLSLVDADLFHSFQDTSGGVQSCWEWTGKMAEDRDGYGWFDFTDGVGGSYAHRVAVVLHQGFDMLDGEYVRHFMCDNKICTNPRHLRVGTNIDNINDEFRRRFVLECQREGGPSLKIMIEGLRRGWHRSDMVYATGFSWDDMTHIRNLAVKEWNSRSSIEILSNEPRTTKNPKTDRLRKNDNKLLNRRSRFM